MENKNYKDEQFDSFLTKTIILSSKRYFKKEINTNRKEQIIFDDQNYSAFIQGFLTLKILILSLLLIYLFL